ncbi:MULTISPECIES: site-specific integrase [Rhodococcus]|uniref:site-specific integrase n=1 Tax=Rhodococcus TaxID=1827 RepID=UPI001EE41C8F|nr:MULTISPECIES: site-specific integrase [Rhodococcus]WML64731.1 site-specific integrase [Rhodococcus sp. AH-ZY2]
MAPLCGLRCGEIAGLRWPDVDLGAGTLTIANSRARAGSRTVEGEPKSAAGRRTLPILPALRVALEAARRRQQRERLALGPDYGAGAYVVSNEAGEPYSPEVISEYWRRHVRRAGVRPIRLHDARHTAATALHLQGVPVAVIAAWIGHSDGSFTLRTYAHSQHEALQAAAAVLGGVVTTA